MSGTRPTGTGSDDCRRREGRRARCALLALPSRKDAHMRRMTRRQTLRAAAALGSFAIVGRASAAKPFKPNDSLVEAARREGRIVLYTATFVEVEQEVVNEF